MLRIRRVLYLSVVGLLIMLSFKVDAAETEKGKGVSGYYSSTMLIGVDDNSGIVTGWYENYTGWDEQIQAPRFSCSFYLFGKLHGDRYHITTWYPGTDDQIEGSLTFSLRMSSRGCG